MKRAPIIITMLAAAFFAGCGHEHKEGDSHNHATAEADDHEEASPSGASFTLGKGVMIADETRRSLGIEVAKVTAQKLPAQIRFNLQIFGEKHRHAIRTNDHTGCDVQGSGFLPSDKAAAIRIGQPVTIQTRTNETLSGVVLAVEKSLSLAETEIIVGLTNATDQVQPGEFLSAVLTQPRDETVTVIPRAALLQTAEGAFVYVVKEDAFSRTAVKTGGEADGQCEITEGLRAGDSVVTQPVETLYLIELRATKGGGHAH